MKKSYQISSAKLLANFGSLDIYNMDVMRRYTIDNEDTNFFKKKDWALVGITDENDGNSTDHGYLTIHKDFL